MTDEQTALLIQSHNLVDTTAIAARLGVEPGTVHQWRQRDLGFPSPLVVLKIGPVWEWATVEVWAIESGRTTVEP